MTEEREQQEGEADRAGTPFDDNPPVEPSVPQVGNSKARFFVPREEEDGGEEGAGDEEGGDEPGGGDEAPDEGESAEGEHRSDKA